MKATPDTLDNKALLSLSDFCAYLGIGKTKAREILKSPDCSFSFRVGNRLYANKKKLDDWLRFHSEI